MVVWILCAIFAGLITYTLYRRDRMKVSTAIAIPVFVCYIAFVLTITILERTPGREMRYNLELFWTVRAIIDGRRALIIEIFWNIVLFVPIGLTVVVILRRHPMVSVMVGALLSTGIEVAQLLTHRGLFEFDDILYNTMGAAIGLLIYLLVRKQENVSSFV